MMKYLYLLLLSVIFIPISQVAYGQNILDEIGQAFNNLTTGMMGGNETNETASSGSANETGIGSIQDLQDLTSGNQELLSNGSSIAPENNSLGLGLEREQYVESENISNALSAAGINSTQ